MLKMPHDKEKAFIAVVPAFLWQLLFFYIPILLMIIMSFVRYYPSLGVQVFSFDLYTHFLSAQYLIIMVKSLLLACANGILCFMLGYPLAYFIVFKAGRLKSLFLFLLILPFWTNFLLHIYSWFFLLDRAGIVNHLLMFAGIIHEPLYLLNSFFGIMLLMVYCYLPFMVLPIYSALERFDKKLLEASRDLGASRFQTWYHIVLPLSMGGVVSGFFLVFVPSFGEFAIPGLMGGEKYLFVGSVIAQYALGHKTMASATAFTVMSFVCLCIFIMIGMLFNYLFLKRFKENP